MNEIAISVEGISKIYKLYDNPVDRLKETFSPFKKKFHKDFFALRNVSFEVNKGETVGIIGKNGSGKSTLLKIITGVLSPSNGQILVNGRISALLELGAGFNPEYTGMENIFLNATLMGLSREECIEKIPSIIEFADIGEFVNQPVKTYSSGMFVRLAFAVAINVDPDILIIDEALAVGDSLFQRKCFNKIEEFKKSGKTILFVSHSGSSIIELCDKALFIDDGERMIYGQSSQTVNLYHKFLYAPHEKHKGLKDKIKQMDSGKPTMINSISDDQEKDGLLLMDQVFLEEEKDTDYFDASLVSNSLIEYETRGVCITHFEILNEYNRSVNVIGQGKTYKWRYCVEFFKDCYAVRFGMLIKTTTGYELGGSVSALPSNGIDIIKKGTKCIVEFEFSSNLAPGVYFLNCGVMGIENSAEVYLDRRIECSVFRVLEKKGNQMTGVVDFEVSSSVKFERN